MEKRKLDFLDKIVKDHQERIIKNNEMLAFCTLFTDEEKPAGMTLSEWCEKVRMDAVKAKAKELGVDIHQNPDIS